MRLFKDRALLSREAAYLGQPAKGAVPFAGIDATQGLAVAFGRLDLHHLGLQPPTWGFRTVRGFDIDDVDGFSLLL